MLIPKSFNLGNVPYTVQLAKRVRGPAGVVGRVDYKSRTIDIANVHYWTGAKLPDKDISDTFWHEVTHAILDDMNHPLYRDEAFVTAFSKRLNEVVLTAKL
jgi:hypothetical protein